MTHMKQVLDIRSMFRRLLFDERFVTDKTGVKTIDIPFAQFVADEPAIFGKPNIEWHERELMWYRSMSLRVDDIPPPIPAIWKQVASQAGFINSNYGWCVWSGGNYRQYESVRDELKLNPESRRAIMIYTRPTMHSEYKIDGMSDFICTNTVQYLLRDDALHAHVCMRSNDAVFGYKGDRFFQSTVLDELCQDLDLPRGKIIWNCGSLHVYERHFDLVRA